MSSALAAVADWPVDTAAAAIVDKSGVVETFGPVDTKLGLASVTKPLAALAILVAAEEEAVHLDDPADERIVPGATLRHLLAHASGYAPDRPMKAAAPGTRRIYSNVGVERAAKLVTDATDIDFRAYLAEAVLRPLQMSRTTLTGSPARDGVSTVADLAKFVHELLAPTGLIAGPTLQDATTVQYPGIRGVLPGYGAKDPNDWGLGFEIRSHKSPHWTGSQNSPRTYGHFGQSGTMFWVDPEAEVGLVALADRAFGPWAAEAWPALSDAVRAAATSA
jgi:CubicO group peptidase (beta-lactamase class C family)